MAMGPFPACSIEKLGMGIGTRPVTAKNFYYNYPKLIQYYVSLAWTCKVSLVDILVVVPVVTSSCMHTTSLGSGSHSPLHIHIDELGPLSDEPDRHMNVMLSPSSAGYS